MEPSGRVFARVPSPTHRERRGGRKEGRGGRKCGTFSLFANFWNNESLLDFLEGELAFICVF
jgi:hypothetical protein